MKCDDRRMQAAALTRCQEVFPSWRGLSTDDFVFDEPKGFSSFTMGIHAPIGVEIGAGGRLTVNKEKLEEALALDPISELPTQRFRQLQATWEHSKMS